MNKNENIEIKRILDILKGKKIMIVIILMLFALFGYLYSFKYVSPKYKSVATLLLIPENTTITNSDLTLNSRLISTYGNIAENSKILNTVIKNLSLNMTEDELSDELQVKIIDDTYIIEITVIDANPQQAMNIAKEITTVFLNEIKDIYNLNNIGVVDEAQLAEEPYNINHFRDLSVFLILGLFVSLGVAVLIYVFDNTIKEEKDIENYIKVKLLGSVPFYDKKDQIVKRDNAKSYVVECINNIRTNILYMNSTKKAKTILLTSCVPKEGKSWNSANIAVAFAETNKKVLLIDADMRKGRANKIFNINNKKGLSDYLHQMTGDEIEDLELGKEYIKETQIPNLHILINGTIPPNPSELIDSDNMKELINILKNAYDIIILDAPPCRLVTDSVILSTIVDSTILVVNSGKTKINDLKEVAKSIQNVGGEIIGAILNKTKIKEKVYKNNYYGHTENIISKKDTSENNVNTVNDIIESAKIKLSSETFEIDDCPIVEDNSSSNNEEDNKKVKQNNETINKLMKQQNIYFNKINNVVSQINTRIDKLDKKEDNKEIEEITNMISSMNGRLDKLDEKEDNKELEQVTNMISSMNDRLDKLDEKEDNKEIEEITNMISSMNDRLDRLDEKEDNKEIEEITNMISSMNDRLDKLDIMEQKDYSEDINNIYENVEELKSHTSKMIIETVNNNNRIIQNIIDNNNEELLNSVKESIDNIEQIDYKEDIEKINKKIEEKNLQTEDLIRQEISAVDYKEKIDEINDIIKELKENYYELFNMVEENQRKQEEIQNKNIIDIKALQEKRDNKFVYSLDEEISYDDLEKSALYVIPIQKSDKKEYSAVNEYKASLRI